MKEKLFEQITEQLTSAVCVIDTTGIISYCNNAFVSLLKSEDKLTDKKIHQLPASWPGTDLYRECLSKKTKLIRKEAFFQRKRLKIICTPLFDEYKNLLYCMQEITILDSAGTVLSSKLQEQSDFEALVLNDKSMFAINQTISRIAYFDSTILIQGESGTGKTVLARHIHNNSNRSGKPFVTINCGAIPENLIESELFGYSSGAFTSASKKGKPGQVELADTGTLFLDEIGLLPYNLQSKFLQLIQEKTYTPIGSLKSKTVDVRIIAATNEDLKALVKEKKFREDLYYRLRVIELFIPPLRERPDAIEPLVKHFLKVYSCKFGKSMTITPTALNVLKNYDWPGNIRELQYVMERIIITSENDTIMSETIPPLQGISSENPPPETIDISQMQDFDSAVAQFEKELLLKTYSKTGSSYKVAAALGISQSKASRLLRKYDIH